jgi:hypothetical protein
MHRVPGDEGSQDPNCVRCGHGSAEGLGQRLREQAEVGGGSRPHGARRARRIHSRRQHGAERHSRRHRLLRQERQSFAGPAGHRGRDRLPGIDVSVGRVAAQRDSHAAGEQASMAPQHVAFGGFGASEIVAAVPGEKRGLGDHRDPVPGEPVRGGVVAHGGVLDPVSRQRAGRVQRGDDQCECYLRDTVHGDRAASQVGGRDPRG